MDIVDIKTYMQAIGREARAAYLGAGHRGR